MHCELRPISPKFAAFRQSFLSASKSTPCLIVLGAPSVFVESARGSKYVKKRGFRGFWRRKGGNVAVILALMLLPISGVVGMAIDVQRQVDTKQKLQHVTDLAALAGAKKYAQNSNSTLSFKVVKRSFKTNVKNVHSDISCSLTYLGVKKRTNSMIVESECKVPTMFGVSISGKDKMSVKTTSTAKASITTLDLALVLDVSGTMSGSKLKALKESAKDLIHNLATGNDRVRIALVPYSSSINAGVYGNRALSRADDDDTENNGVNRVCVTERGGTEAFTDAKPETGAWVGAPTTRSRGCTSHPIVPLSKDATALKALINNLTAGSYTGGHIAVAWAWYMISPEWSDFWPDTAKPRAYDQPDALKVVILMTDGSFNVSNIRAQGDASKQAEKLCEAMRAKHIIIFSIAFKAPQKAERMMKKCASSPDHYFDASNNDELKAAYATIASKFKGVGLIQ